jgi:hypothetical protein
MSQLQRVTGSSLIIDQLSVVWCDIWWAIYSLQGDLTSSIVTPLEPTVSEGLDTIYYIRMKTPEGAPRLAYLRKLPPYQASNSGARWNRVPHATLSLQCRLPCNAHVPCTSEGILGSCPNLLLLVQSRTCMSAISHLSRRTCVHISGQSSTHGITNTHTHGGRSQSIIISAAAEYPDPLTFFGKWWNRS